MVRNYVAIYAHAVSHVVGYYMTVTACTMSCAMLGMLSQFGCYIRDSAAATMAAAHKLPDAKSRGLLDLLFLLSFHKTGKVFYSIWVMLDNPTNATSRLSASN